ncbi:hypothetical protein BDF21DRAFT_406351 [Thamnidium elegans]|nr:hypothetical protein BDF21DRAFT_406351 [Thamnidium elegans]
MMVSVLILMDIYVLIISWWCFRTKCLLSTLLVGFSTTMLLTLDGVMVNLNEVLVLDKIFLVNNVFSCLVVYFLAGKCPRLIGGVFVIWLV